MSEQQLALTAVEPAVELELIDSTIAELADAVVIAAPAPSATELEERNLFGEAERIAGRAACEHPPAVRGDLPRLGRLARGRARPPAHRRRP
ncbi:MAG: hypothetical protein ACXVH3_33490 [Solirubrobacteraceae bacterium]